jgi:Tfp pilus assembly protein FimT
VRPTSRGFTLIELLVVLGVIMLTSGMLIFLPRGDQRATAVRASAEELAATLRLARSIAVERRVVCGVAFNIRNGAGTSGRVLNNFDGGHWYRIVSEVAVPGISETALSTYPVPNFQDISVGTGNVSTFLQEVKSGWIGDAHVLPKRRVRFLALTDQDNGTGGWSGSGIFPATYPRPWFGWFDNSPGVKRLYPWGGYDPAIKDPAGRSCGGFYFQGDDGPISGSLNPADRFTTHLGWGTPVPAVAILSAGKARPLVNGDWLDYVIAFLPDGTVREQSPMQNRRTSYAQRGAATAQYQAGGTGNGDLGAFAARTSGETSPMTSYWNHTGRLSITVCPDADKDTDVFASPAEAMASMWPAFRVSVSRLGDVQVVPVSRSVPKDPVPVIDSASVTNWQSTAQILSRYRNFIATNADGSLRGQPITNFLTPEILAGRQWWLQ